MEAFWWTMFGVAITFYTLWVAGHSGKRKKMRKRNTYDFAITIKTYPVHLDTAQGFRYFSCYRKGVPP